MEYSTRDFYIGSCLLASGLRLIKIQRQSNGPATFIFHDPESKAEQIILAHWNKQLVIPTRDLIEAINELKTRLHGGL
jgi:hypothetical protein